MEWGSHRIGQQPHAYRRRDKTHIYCYKETWPLKTGRQRATMVYPLRDGWWWHGEHDSTILILLNMECHRGGKEDTLLDIAG